MAQLFSRFESGTQITAGNIVGDVDGASGLNAYADRLNSISTDNNLITGSLISGTNTVFNGSMVSGTSMWLYASGTNLKSHNSGFLDGAGGITSFTTTSFTNYDEAGSIVITTGSGRILVNACVNAEGRDTGASPSARIQRTSLAGTTNSPRGYTYMDNAMSSMYGITWIDNVDAGENVYKLQCKAGGIGDEVEFSELSMTAVELKNHE